MKKGMSLIEILVTSTILVIGITGLITTFVFCHRMIIQNTHRQNAMFIINEYLEGVQNRETEAAVKSFVSYYSEAKPVTTTLNTGLSQDYMLSMKLDSNVEPVTGAFLNIVTATVTWYGGGPGREMSVSMITNEPEI